MPDTTTLNEAARSPIDGTETLRAATAGANWKIQLSDLFASTYFLGGTYAFTGLGLTHISDTTQSTTAATGSLTLAGGLGVAKAAFVGGAVTTGGNLTIPGGNSYLMSARGGLGSSANGAFQLFNNGFAANVNLTVSTNDVLTIGGPNAASPVPQTLQVQSPRGGTDTDTAGADYTFNASQSTGTAAGGNIVEQTTFSAKSTSNAANTLVKRRVVNAKGKVLTSGAAASLVDITLPTLAMAGGSIRATIVCTNGTDMQSYSQVITFAAVNKGAAYTTQITAPAANDAKAVSAGTLTAAWSILNGTNKVTIQLTATTSLTPSANAFLVYYQIENNSEQAITIL